MLSRRVALALAAAMIVAAPISATAGRPTIFELQTHLKSLSDKQRAREASQPMPASAPVFGDKRAPEDSSKGR